MALVGVLMIGAPAAQAEFNAALRYGKSVLRIGDDGVRARIRLGANRDQRRERRQARDRRPGTVVIVRERTRLVREPAAPAPPAPATTARPPAAAAPVIERAPLDPAGSNRLLTARGRSLPPEIFELGAVLPPNRPHVLLDARHYDLPPPPPGQIYARVGRSVLRIDADDRRVMAVVAR